jgi:hypothetical protein
VVALTRVAKQRGKNQQQAIAEALGGLYQALHDGWEPIMRCWPELAEYNDALDQRKPNPLVGCPAPVLAWITAKQALQAAGLASDQWAWLAVAWADGTSEYQPPDDPTPLHADPKPLQVFCQSLAATKWPALEQAIAQSAPPENRPTAPAPTQLTYQPPTLQDRRWARASSPSCGRARRQGRSSSTTW